MIDAKGVQALAKMPGLQELRAQIAGDASPSLPPSWRASSATPGQQLARVLGARKEQLEKRA